MDYIKHDKQGNYQHILCNDHRPNPAFNNEFQTNYFTFKLNKIESFEENYQGYYVENGSFVIFEVEIKNNIDEVLDLFREDFLCSFNKEEPYYPEEYFFVEKQLSDEIIIQPFSSIEGNFIFLAPKQIQRMDLFHSEYYDEENYKEYHLRYRIEKST